MCGSLGYPQTANALRFRMKSIEGDFVSDTDVVGHLRWQLPRAFDSGEALMLRR
jgi:hypothetical protein